MKHLLLIGGGHSHVEVIRRFGREPPAGVRITLLSPERYTYYSGMLPGFLAGHYAFDDCHIDLGSLCERARVGFAQSSATAIDPASRRVTCAEGTHIDYDVASIDIGSTPGASVPGALAHAVPVKPVSRFLSAWDAIRDSGNQGGRRIAVVGGGAGGVELLFAMQYRLAPAGSRAGNTFHIVTDTPSILPAHPAAARRIAERLLRDRGVELHVASKVVRVDAQQLCLDTGATLDADHIVWATAAAAAPWIASSGLAADARGFVAVDDALQSVSHPGVFAAGDIATMTDHPLPKSGVHAVRQGPPLAENLRRALIGGPLVAHRPQRLTLALISTGGRHAIASWGPVAFEGDWVWRWKDLLDRRFMNRYRDTDTAR